MFLNPTQGWNDDYQMSFMDKKLLSENNILKKCIILIKSFKFYTRQAIDLNKSVYLIYK